MRNLTAATAYKKSATYRSLREQEADLFLSVNAGLQNARNSDSASVAKALANNELLWIAVMDILRDPSNQLPVHMRAAILSIGHAARREMAAKSPDLNFLAGLNEQIATGLSGV